MQSTKELLYGLGLGESKPLEPDTRPSWVKCKEAQLSQLSKLVSLTPPRSSPLAPLDGPPSPSDQSTPTRKGFHFLSLAELLTSPCPTNWLIRDYLEAGCLAELIGETEVMKSFMAIDQGLCLASGLPWHGYAIPNKGPVIYLAGEGFNGLAKRIQVWLVAHGMELASIPFFVASAPAKLLDEGHAKTVTNAVVKLAKDHGPPKLVIIDTLARSFIGGDENSSKDMTAFVAALDALKARFGCAVLVVHHSGLQEKGRGRGSSVLRAAMDFEYLLTVNKDGVRVLTCSKVKDHKAPQRLTFVHEVMGTGWTDPETFEEITSCVLRLAEGSGGSGSEEPKLSISKAHRIALYALHQACEKAGGPVDVNVWRDEAIDRGISSSEIRKIQSQEFRRAKDRIVELGLAASGHEDCWGPTAKGLQRLQDGFMKPLKPGRQGFKGFTPF